MSTRVNALLNEYPVITVLIKGSRSAAMENVVRALQEGIMLVWLAEYLVKFYSGFNVFPI